MRILIVGATGTIGRATETLQAMGMPLTGGLPAAVVARAYVRSIEGTDTGQVLAPSA